MLNAILRAAGSSVRMIALTLSPSRNPLSALPTSPLVSSEI